MIERDANVSAIIDIIIFLDKLEYERYCFL